MKLAADIATYYLNNDTVWLGVKGVSSQPSNGASVVFYGEVIDPIINDFRMI